MVPLFVLVGMKIKIVLRMEGTTSLCLLCSALLFSSCEPYKLGLCIDVCVCVAWREDDDVRLQEYLMCVPYLLPRRPVCECAFRSLRAQLYTPNNSISDGFQLKTTGDRERTERIER